MGWHMHAGVSHQGDVIKHEIGTVMLTTAPVRRGKKKAMPPRPDDLYDAAALRASIQSWVSRDGRKNHAIARAAKVSPNTLLKILDGVTTAPQIDGLVRLARLFGITVSELIGETSPRDPSEPDNGQLAQELEALRDLAYQQAALVTALVTKRTRKP